MVFSPGMRILCRDAEWLEMHLARALAERFGLAFSDKPEDQPDQPLGILHGGMADIHLAATVESFGTGVSPLLLLLATDVASEGVNLHHQCHHIIHYDLPWSIITLIQRNGRIDRFGQRHSPVIRYLMVRTEDGFLAGDRAIFERLIEKVEEINRSTRSGESVLKLYDADKEEHYIATHGLLAGDREVFRTSVRRRTSSSARPPFRRRPGPRTGISISRPTPSVSSAPSRRRWPRRGSGRRNCCSPTGIRCCRGCPSGS